MNPSVWRYRLLNELIVIATEEVTVNVFKSILVIQRLSVIYKSVHIIREPVLTIFHITNVFTTVNVAISIFLISFCVHLPTYKNPPLASQKLDHCAPKSIFPTAVNVAKSIFVTLFVVAKFCALNKYVPSVHKLITSTHPVFTLHTSKNVVRSIL